MSLTTLVFIFDFTKETRKNWFRFCVKVKFMMNTWDIHNGATDVKEKEKWYLVQEQQDHRRLKYRRRLSDYQSPCFQLKGAGAFHSAGQSKEG